jgi:hypothetical protein
MASEKPSMASPVARPDPVALCRYLTFLFYQHQQQPNNNHQSSTITNRRNET